VTLTPARSALSLSELSPTPTTIKVRSEQSRVRETSLRRVLDTAGRLGEVLAAVTPPLTT
jgi:hypothetical protein